jgi:hypothetical protein
VPSGCNLAALAKNPFTIHRRIGVGSSTRIEQNTASYVYCNGVFTRGWKLKYVSLLPSADSMATPNDLTRFLSCSRIFTAWESPEYDLRVSVKVYIRDGFTGGGGGGGVGGGGGGGGAQGACVPFSLSNPSFSIWKGNILSQLPPYLNPSRGNENLQKHCSA